MKELKVRLHHIDQGQCMEVWEVQTEKGKPWRFLSRNDGFTPHEWGVLADAPYGYCEVECYLREDITLIICDKDWNELFRDGMDKERFPKGFPSLDEACNEAWNDISASLPNVTRQGFGEWITKQSYTPLSETDRLNWRDCWQETVKVEIISRFTWIGEEYGIFRLHQRHTKCDATWYEYYSGKVARYKQEGYVRFFAYEYRERHIREVIHSLGTYCDRVHAEAVQTRSDEYGHEISYFMGQFLGYDLSFDAIRDAKDSFIRGVNADYNEAYAYYMKLKDNETSVRCLNAELYYIRKQIEKAKEEKK